MGCRRTRQWAGVCVQFGAQVAEEAEEPHLGYSGPRGWGVPCREGSGPRAGVPFQAGLRTQAPPPGPPEPWLAAAHRATNVPQRIEPSGSFKAAPNPRPRAQLPALPPPPAALLRGGGDAAPRPRAAPAVPTARGRSHAVPRKPRTPGAPRPRVSDDPFHMAALDLLCKHEEF